MEEIVVGNCYRLGNILLYVESIGDLSVICCKLYRSFSNNSTQIYKERYTLTQLKRMLFQYKPIPASVYLRISKLIEINFSTCSSILRSVPDIPKVRNCFSFAFNTETKGFYVSRRAMLEGANYSTYMNLPKKTEDRIRSVIQSTYGAIDAVWKSLEKT